MDAKWCWQPEVGLPKPDLVIFLSMPLQRIVARSNFGDELYENANFQEKVIANFHEMTDPTWQVSKYECNDLDCTPSFHPNFSFRLGS